MSDSSADLGKRFPTIADLLHREFALRMAANSRYTLRAFARDAGVYPSKMSEILRGKSGVSGSRARVIAKKLNWDTETADIFHKVAVSQSARSPQKRVAAKAALQMICDDSKRQLSEREFRIMADWYHLAILSLAEILGGRVDVQLVCSHLQISAIQAKAALIRLSEMNLMGVNDKWFVLKNGSTIIPGVRSSQALKTFHGQMLEKARQALVNQSNDERDNSAIVLTMKKANLQKAKDLVRNFRRQFLSLMSSDDSCESDSVYCLSLQLFQLAHVDKLKTGDK